MTLLASVFTIAPSDIDGRQRLSDPTGEEYEPPVAGLLPVTGLRVTANSHNSQTIEWDHDGVGIDGFAVNAWIEGQDDAWQDIATGTGPGVLIQVNTPLPEGYLVRYRVAAGIAGPPLQLSAWAEIEETTLLNPASGGDTQLTQITFFHNFENFTEGQEIRGTGNGFTTCRNFTCKIPTAGPHGGYYPEAAYAGTKCGHTYLSTVQNPGSSYSPPPITADGTTGWGWWGYVLESIPEPQEGCEMWWRKAIFWPTDAQTSTSGTHMKQQRFMRQNSQGSQGSSECCILGDMKMALHQETVPDTFPNGYGGYTDRRTWDAPPVVEGTWTLIEAYFKFSSDMSQAKAAYWQDGKPYGREEGTMQTMVGTGEWVHSLYMGTYWNNGIENYGNYQEQWYDQVAVAIQGPTNQGQINDAQYLDTDEDGYTFIGTAVNTTAGAGNH
jgi:hypothetical protein